MLDLCDRMGIMVMDEFFDAWTVHKLAADYGGAQFNTWGTIDLTDTIKRDRNHPSVVLYSIGNEIRDAHRQQMTTATNLANVCHMVDPTRPVTQALFRPLTAATSRPPRPDMLDILDVFGANYRIAEVPTAIALTPHHAGVVTEDGSTSTSDWATVTANPALTGEFIWTASTTWARSRRPCGRPSARPRGIMDRMGTHKPIRGQLPADVEQQPPVAHRRRRARPRQDRASAADHTTMVTDPNDVVYIKATVADSQRPGRHHRRRPR